jgi:hypothetical protein
VRGKRLRPRAAAALIAAALAFGAAGPALAQPAPAAPSVYEVGQDQALPIGVKNVVAIEPHLAIDPRNGAHMIAAAFLAPQGLKEVTGKTCAAFTTFDGGRSWSTHVFPVKGCGDPWVVIRPDGSAVYLTLADDTQEQIAFASPDGGRTWRQGFNFGLAHDHGTLAVDPSGAVYAFSQQGGRDAAGKARDVLSVGRSEDGGLTFRMTRLIPGTVNFSAMNGVVMADGTVVAPYSDYRRSLAPGGSARLLNERDHVVTSTDQGRTFSPPSLVSEVCKSSFPELAVDASSGPFRNRLYYVCNDGLFENVFFHYSADGGDRWSAPKAINPPARPRAYVRFPVVAVNRDGVVGVAWYDGRNDSRGYRNIFRCQEVFFAASLDGGATFEPDVKVSSARNCPDTDANGEAGRRWPAGGDYFGLEAAPDGRFHLVWADSREGMYKLRTNTVRVRGTVAASK